MAVDFATALHRALVAHLKADAGVGGFVSGRVYDEPPQNAARPFLRIGNLAPRPMRSALGNAARVTFSIEAHSRKPGRVEATLCAEAVVAALDQADLAVDGFTAFELHWITQTVERDGDGEGHLAIIVFGVTLDE